MESNERQLRLFECFEGKKKLGLNGSLTLQALIVIRE